MNSKNVVGAAVTCVWVACALASLLSHDPVPLTAVTPPFLIYAGYVFGLKTTLLGNGNGGKK